MKTCVDWRSIPSKKVERDWTRYILAIILEPILVSKYRATLLMKCPTAAYLQSMAHSLLSSHCRRQNTLVREKQSYVFVDGIDILNILPQKPAINVELTIGNWKRQSDLQMMRQELIAVVCTFDKLKGIAAKPGTNLMADGIKEAFDIIVEVRYLIIIFYCYWSMFYRKLLTTYTVSMLWASIQMLKTSIHWIPNGTMSKWLILYSMSNAAMLGQW